jgi:hypothetical protein
MGNLDRGSKSYGAGQTILASLSKYDTRSVMVSDVGILPDENHKKIVRAGTIVGGIGGSVMLNQDLMVAEHGAATLYTSLPGHDNDLLYVALTAAATTVAYADPGAASTPISASASSGNITVTLGTDADGKIISTANDVKNIINNTAATKALVEAKNIVSDSGDGIVTAMPQAALAPHTGVPAPEGLLFNDVDVTYGPSPCAMLYMGSVEVSRLPKAPSAAQITALPRVSFMDYNNRAVR